jgi:hypothetical protein
VDSVTTFIPSPANAGAVFRHSAVQSEVVSRPRPKLYRLKPAQAAEMYGVLTDTRLTAERTQLVKREVIWQTTSLHDAELLRRNVILLTRQAFSDNLLVRLKRCITSGGRMERSLSGRATNRAARLDVRVPCILSGFSMVSHLRLQCKAKLCQKGETSSSSAA